MESKKLAVASAMVLAIVSAISTMTMPAVAQQRGQYFPGSAVVAAGTMPEPGLSYSNMFYFSSGNRLKSPAGGPVPISGQFSIMADDNTFVYVPNFKFLGGNLGFFADVEVANGSLGALLLPASSGIPINGGGGGLADTWVAPFALGWHLSRADIQTGYSFFAPTGRYTPGASNNVGAGFWTNAAFAGATVYLKKNRSLSANVYNMYEWHTQKEGTNVTPGQTDSVDYSVLQILHLSKRETTLLQFGPVGIGQWQTTRNGGDTPVRSSLRYAVDGVGLTANIVLPEKKLSVGMTYIWEYAAASTYEGKILTVTAAFSF